MQVFDRLPGDRKAKSNPQGGKQGGKQEEADMRKFWMQNAHLWTPGQELSKSRYRPIKFLGQGGQGMAGLWEYIGQNKDTPQFIVVKQSFRSLEREARFYGKVSKTNSRHFPVMYRYSRKLSRFLVFICLKFFMASICCLRTLYFLL